MSTWLGDYQEDHWAKYCRLLPPASLFLPPLMSLFLSLGPAMGACEWSSSQDRCCRGFQGRAVLLSQCPLGSLVAPDGWGKLGSAERQYLTPWNYMLQMVIRANFILREFSTFKRKESISLFFCLSFYIYTYMA